MPFDLILTLSEYLIKKSKRQNFWGKLFFLLRCAFFIIIIIWLNKKENTPLLLIINTESTQTY